MRVGGWLAGLRHEYNTLRPSSRMGLSSGPSVAKWNHHANGVESVAACAQSKDDRKQTKMTVLISKNRGV